MTRSAAAGGLFALGKCLREEINNNANDNAQYG